MRLFAHTIAEYNCTKRCGYHRSVTSPNLALFDLVAGFVAAIPWSLVLLRNPWDFPWYYFSVSLRVNFC